MRLQVALDRLSIPAAITVAEAVAPHAQWIEVGTSLIKEFGMDAVRQLRLAVSDRLLLADVKTNDNARYEFALCYEAGADAATVMGTAAAPTIDACVEVASAYERAVMIDLLATTPDHQRTLVARYPDAIFALHVGIDLQETAGPAGSVPPERQLPPWAAERRIAVAGGLTLLEIPALERRCPEATVIVGRAITATPDPAASARLFALSMSVGDPLG